jgi:hypothetical protein
MALSAQAAWGACAPQKASPGYRASVAAALGSKSDLWGSALVRSAQGPTFAKADRHLAPLLYARTSKGRPLTRSGVYYLPFAQPEGPGGAGSVELHVADGSEILSGSVDGPGLLISVGGAAYGSCLSSLTPAKLADGWLPILETRYAGYAQESFAAHTGGSPAGPLASFLRITGPGSIRLTPTVHGLRRKGNRLVRGARTYLVFDGSARWNGGSLTFARGPVYAAWVGPPGGGYPEVDAAAYASARNAVVRYWRERLAEGAQLAVPEPRVMNAERALLVQNLELAWRYSIGNPYEEFSFPESLDGAEVMAELGFGAVSRSTLRVSFTRKPRPYPSWTMGEKLLGAAVYVRLSGDARFLAQVTQKLAGYVTAIGRRQEGSGLLAPEHFSSDIPDSVQGLHGQAVAWQGLNEIADVWAARGRPGFATKARRIAGRLGAALRRAVASSERRLPDGSLFLPMRLGGGEEPYATVTESRAGSYWNLVAPYAFASGLFAPASPQAQGALDYLLHHGSRLLGLVRAGGYALYGPGANPLESGTDAVYDLNASRFLAAEDEPDQLVLSLYGQLAAGMTPNTFVAGEAASVAPLDGLRDRAMYLPPNSIANDAFLETLKLTLVQETESGLRLAFATPRAWLRPGRRIAVGGLPTSFGPLSFSLVATSHLVTVQLELPDANGPRTVALRLRLPPGKRIVSVSPHRRFDAATGTIELDGATGTLDLRVRTS